MVAEPLDWNVAVYCANEAGRLKGCLSSIATALTGRRALITVLLNGSHDGSQDVVREASRAGLPVEVFRIAAADKSNAINQFYHALRTPARAYAGVDGYVYIAPGSFRAFEARLDSDPKAMAVTAVPTTGRTMAATADAIIATGGRLQGNFHALRPDFLDRIVARRIRLPVGLYRGDGLLGSMAAHNLEPLTEPWDNSRVPGIRDASFATQSLSAFRPRDIQRQLRRKVRQMRGIVENAAIKSIIYKAGYESLPDDADTMIREYLAVHGAPAVAAIDRLFLSMAIRHSASARPFKPADLVPHRVALG